MVLSELRDVACRNAPESVFLNQAPPARPANQLLNRSKSWNDADG